MAKKKGKKKAKAKGKYETGCDIKLPDITTLHVSQENIDEGVPGDSNYCAIALAVKDVLAESGLEFDESTVSVGGSNSSFDVTIPVSTPVVVGGKVVETIDRTASVHVELNLGSKADKFISKFDDVGQDEDGNDLPTKAKPTSFKTKPNVTVDLQDW